MPSHVMHVRSVDSSTTATQESKMPNLVDECKRTEMMGNVVQDASQFLFPCAIEYSLICAAILYLMWRNVSVSNSDRIYQRSISGGSAAARRSRHQYSVDCAKANKGLFGGIFVLVGTIISLILFFALISSPEFRHVAILEVGVTRLVVFCFAFVATLIGIFQVGAIDFLMSNCNRNPFYFVYRFVNLLSTRLVISDSTPFSLLSPRSD